MAMLKTSLLLATCFLVGFFVAVTYFQYGSPPAIISDLTVTRTSNPTPPSLEKDWGSVACPLTELSKDHLNLHYHLTTAAFPCQFKVSVGGVYDKGVFDGEKWICVDKKFSIKKNNCIVLSFGISTDWSFDDEIDTVFGCKVYAFDPTIGKENHNRSSNIQFFNMGISDKAGVLQKGTLDSYGGILKMLKLENAVIDYLKMDVEFFEYSFFKDVLVNTPNLLKNVKQIGMELHLPGREKEAWVYVQQLECLGFKIIFHNLNPSYPGQQVNGRSIGSLYEMVWGLDRKW